MSRVGRLSTWFAQVKRLSASSAPEPMYDRLLLSLIFILSGIGLVMVFSATTPLGSDPYSHIQKHSIYLISGLALGAFCLTLPTSLWTKYSWAGVCITTLLLGIVLVFGRSINGATRWLHLGIGNFQVAELAKLTLCVFLAGYLVRRAAEIKSSIGGFSKAMAVPAIYSTLIFFQPDLGSIVVLLVVLVGMLVMAGARWRELMILVVFGLGIVGAAIAFAPFRVARLMNFTNPWEDPFGVGYQLTQSLMAYGRGDWFGQGLGNSIQKLEYLPEAHTDFIFSVLGEELGFIGVLVVFSLLFVLAFRAIWIGYQAIAQGQDFSGYLAYGIGIWFSFQTFVNVGASMGALPTKGLTLPFVSYGGSSLWVMTVASAIVLRIDYERRLAQNSPHVVESSHD